MICFALTCLFAAGAPQRKDEPPAAPPAQLSKADAEWVAKKYDEAVQFGRVGKWGADEAQAPIREIVDRCTRVLGNDHYVTADYRREIEYLKKLTELKDADRAEFIRSYKLTDERDEFAKELKYTEALKPAEEIVAIYRRCLGPDSFYEGLARIQHGLAFRSCERYSEAEEQFRSACKIFHSILGEYHHSTIGARIHLALSLDKQYRYADARPEHDKALEHVRRLLGETHPMTSVARNNLAGHLDHQAQYGEAEKLYRNSLEDLRAALGEEHSMVLTGRNNLAYNLDNQGKHEEAEKLYRQVMEARRAAGKDDSDFAMSCGNLAVNLDNQSQHVVAETLHRKAVEILQRTARDAPSTTAMALSNLAVNLDHQGKFEEAETHLEKALQLFLAAPGGATAAGTATTYSNLANCFKALGKDAAAKAAAEKSLAIFQKILDPHHPKTAAACNNLAACLNSPGHYGEAEPHFRTSLTALQKRLGEDNPATAEGHSNLSVNLYYQGRFAEAEPHNKTALETLRRMVGEGHPKTAWAYKNVIGNACARGDYRLGETLGPAAVASFESARLRLGSAGLDRAVRTADVSPLPGLAVAAARRNQPLVAWQMLERNLARGLLDTLAARPLEPGDRQQESALLGKLKNLDQQLDLLRSQGPGAEAERRKVEIERDTTQTLLARFQSELDARLGVASGTVYDLPRIRSQIPEGAALVAWIDLPDVPNWHDPKGDHWVCVLRHEGDPVWVQLSGSGPGGAWKSDDERLAANARRAFAIRSDDPKAGWKELAGKLANQRLAPLENHLKDIRHLIVLPSADLAGIPVELLSERTVSYAPSGTMLAWLREKRAGAAATPPARHLLALGDPAFKNNGPTPLPGTRQEVAGISRVFDRTSEFKGPEASEQNLERLATDDDGLRRFPYLHFATHGVLDFRRPMHSALLLAQNRLPDPLDGKVVYDGRLTAERMLRTWKLDAELVTLSGCDTGLGTYSGGEGYLGFSQALFVAGARSLVLSLWAVDDTATALLMTRFYENLMGLPAGVPGGPVEAKPTKAEALAEAKRWLRTLSPAEVEVLRKELPRNGTRGDIVKKAPPAKAPPSYDHPYYWSGFVLIGDPR